MRFYDFFNGLTSASSLGGTEYLVLIQSGATKKIMANTFLMANNAHASLAAAVQAIGSTPTALLISTPDFPSGGDVTVPSTLSVQFLGDGSLATSAGDTIVFEGPFSAPQRQIFSGDGVVTFDASACDNAYPEWWGAVGDGVTDDTEAVQSAIDCGIRTTVLNRTYGVTTIEMLNKTVHRVTGIGTLKSLDGTVETLHLSGCQDILIEHITLYGTFETEGPVGMESMLRIDPNLTGTSQVNKRIIIFNVKWQYNPSAALYIGGNSTTYGATSDIIVTRCRMDLGLGFMLAVGVKNLLVDGVIIEHVNKTPVNPGLAQDEDIAVISANGASCENITIENIIINANGTASSTYTGRPKFDFRISEEGLYFTNLAVSNITCKDNLGNYVPTYGSNGATLYVADVNATRDHFINATFSKINFYNSPGIHIEANNLIFDDVNLHTFPSIANFAGYGRAIDSTTAVSTKGCKFSNVKITDWNAGDPLIYTAEGYVEFNGLHVIGADGAIWAAPYNVYNNMILDDVGCSAHGSFWCQLSLSPFVLNNVSFLNFPYIGLMDNIASRATGCVLTNAHFESSESPAYCTNLYEDYWMIHGILSCPTYADDAAARAGGLGSGDWYKTSAGVYHVVDVN